MAYSKIKVNKVIKDTMNGDIINFDCLDNYMYIDPVDSLDDVSWWSRRLDRADEPHMIVELIKSDRSYPYPSVLSYTILKNLEGHKAKTSEQIYIPISKHEHRRSTNLSLADVKVNPTVSNKSKSVIGFDGSVEREFNSITDAARVLRISRTTIGKAIASGNKTFGIAWRLK